MAAEPPNFMKVKTADKIDNRAEEKKHETKSDKNEKKSDAKIKDTNKLKIVDVTAYDKVKNAKATTSEEKTKPKPSIPFSHSNDSVPINFHRANSSVTADNQSKATTPNTSAVEPDEKFKIELPISSSLPKDSIRTDSHRDTDLIVANEPNEIIFNTTGKTSKSASMNTQSSKSSSRKSLKLERLVTRAAVEYYPLLSNFNDNNLLRLDTGYSTISGPNNVADGERRMQIINQDNERKKKARKPVAKDAMGRRLFFMTHGEQTDKIFPKWTKHAYSKSGRYKPDNLNMQGKLPKRVNFKDFANDSPLTEIGYLSSQMVGRNMRMAHQTVKVIYTSPALICLQTANAMLKTCRRDFCCKVNVEPGLYEYLGSHKDNLPIWMTTKEIFKANFEIDRDYKPIVSVEEIKHMAELETAKSYYERSNKVITSILDHNEGNSKILIITHASSIDACTWHLLGNVQKHPTVDEIKLRKTWYPNCSVLVLQENTHNETWQIEDRILSNLTYSGISNRIDDRVFKRS